MWAAQRLHQYVYARPFLLVTDHKPLIFLFHEHKNIPEMAISRIQRWVNILFSYQYIQYRSTEKHSNADVFSRCPLGEAEGTDVRADVLYVDGGETSIFAFCEDKHLLDSSRGSRGLIQCYPKCCTM